VSLLPLVTVTGADAQQEPKPTLPPLQVVVLVDESGSLSEPDVVKEKEAARTIVFSVLASNSVVSVVGFGSSNGPGQSAVRVACQPTVLDAPQKKDSLAQCVESLHRRTPEEGNGTDHVAALQQALAYVRSGGPEKKVVFLLTDGKLDVSESPSWGSTPERRNAAALAKVKDVLADLDSAGAQVWPLGFGNVDNAALRDFAQGKSCTPGIADPHEQITPTSTALYGALTEAFSSASCVKYGPLETGHLPTGGSVDFTIEIPPVASDASIVVYKRDPRVLVEYRDPSNKPVSAGPNFEPAGQATETESLRITEPEPGRWTIHLSSADVPAQDVAATVVYQAAVKANLTVSPPQPAAGQPVDVDMQVWARGHAITDPQSLAGLSFVTTLTGSSGFPQQQVTLSDPDHDGTFTGQLTVPNGASGDITFTGQVSGIGIGGDTRELSTKVLSAAAAIQAQILFDTNRAAVTPGGTISGTVSVTNNSGQPARLRLDVADPSPGTALTVDPATVQAAPGTSTTAFTLRFGANTAIGSSGATLRLVDDANPSVVVAQRQLATEVAPEPGLGQKLFWLWVALGALLLGALLFLLARLRARSQASKVRGLRAQLLQSGFAKSELEPREPSSKIFRFVLHEDFTGMQLQHAGPNEGNVYEIRRAGPKISLTLPGQLPVFVAPGERREIGRDLAVVILDERGMGGAGETVGGPVSEVSFDPFGGSAPGPSGPSGPSASSYGSFGGSAAPGPMPPPADPFAGSYGDPFADSASQAPTATFPTPDSARSGGDFYQADSFGDDPTRRNPASPGPASSGNDAYVDPNNPFR
jgi:hypothetical protein